MKVQETPPDQKRLDLTQAVIVDAAALLDVDPQERFTPIHHAKCERRRRRPRV